MDLERARDALRRHDFAVARDALIAAWRARRSPALAELAELVSAHAPDAIAGKLEELITPRVASSHANLRALRGIDDPRISGFAIRSLLRLPFTAPTARAFLHELIEIVEELGDPRLIEHVEAITTGIATRVNRLAIRTELADHVRRVGAALAPVTATEAERELVRLVEPLRTQTRSLDALLAEVHAHPDDDGPRLVLADLLLERGDPRGELIALQIERGAGAPTEREQQLLKKHGKQWLGNLAPVLSWGRGYAQTEFRRGFVAVADIILSVGKKLDPIRADPAWATVEELRGSWDTELLLTAPLRALRRIDRPLDAATIARLAARPLPNVRSLRFNEVHDLDPDLLRAAVPNLERICIYQRSVLASDLEAFRRFGLPCLEVTNNWVERDVGQAREAFAAYVQGLVGTPAPVARLVLQAPALATSRSHDTVELVRGAHGRFERV